MRQRNRHASGALSPKPLFFGFLGGISRKTSGFIQNTSNKTDKVWNDVLDQSWARPKNPLFAIKSPQTTFLNICRYFILVYFWCSAAFFSSHLPAWRSYGFFPRAINAAPFLSSRRCATSARYVGCVYSSVECSTRLNRSGLL